MKKMLLFLLLLPCVCHPQIINTFAGVGTAGYTGNGGLASAAELNHPNGIAVDAVGNIYFSEFLNNTIRKISTSGIISLVAGTGYPGFSGDGGPATAAEINNPVKIALDRDGNIYLADYGNNRVRKIDGTTGIITTVAGTGDEGYTGDGVPATTTTLYHPSGVAVDAAGNLYIADFYNERVRKVDVTGMISTIAGNGSIGSSGDGGLAIAAELHGPFGVCLDASGNILIADAENDKIRKVNAAGTITTFAGTGASGTDGDGGLATAATFADPSGIAADAAGNVYIVDQYSNKIRKVSPSGIISTIAGNGIESFSGDGGLATAAEMDQPNEMTFDAAGNILVSDVINNRLRIITNCVSTIAAQPVGDTVFVGDTARYSVSLPTGSASATYQWQEDPGTGFVNLANVWPYSGTTTDVLTIQSASFYLGGTHYRCIINAGTPCADTSLAGILLIRDGTAGISQLSESTIQLFPNPANSEVTIKLPVRPIGGSIQLVSETGQVLLQKDINKSVFDLNIASLPSGMYFARIAINGQVIYKKLTKN